MSRPQVLGFPVRFVPFLHFTDLRGRRPSLQSPGSRRGVAPCRLGAPPAAPLSPALPRVRHRPSGPGSAAFRAAPPAAWHSRPSAPVGLPPCLRARPDDRCAATGPPLRHLVLLLCPVPADLAALGLPVLGRLRPASRPHKPADAPLGRNPVVLRAIGRQTLRADCLGPPIIFQTLARSRSDLTSFGRSGSLAFAQSAPRPHEDADAPPSCAKVARGRLSPPSSETGVRGRSFSSRSP